MTQKRTDLAKKLAVQLTTRMKQTGAPDRFGKASGKDGVDGPKLNPLIAGLLKKTPPQEK